MGPFSAAAIRDLNLKIDVASPRHLDLEILTTTRAKRKTVTYLSPLSDHPSFIPLAKPFAIFSEHSRLALAT